MSKILLKNKNSRRTVFLPSPTVFQEVSFIHTGLVDELSALGHTIVMLVNTKSDSEKFRRFFHNSTNIIVETADPEIPLFKRLLFGLIPGILSFKNINNLAPITQNRIEKKTRFILKLFSKLMPESMLVWAQNMFLTSPEHDRLFLRYRPGLVILSDPGNIALNRHLARSARKFGVPVIAAEQSIDDPEICSWLPKLDTSCAWGKDMKDEFIRYHRYPEDDVSVIGLLRGDIYKKESLLMNRDEFLKKEGLDTDKKLITIATTSSDPKIFCDIAKSILQYSAQGLVSCPIQIYFRLTPYQYQQRGKYMGEFLNNPLVHIGEPFSLMGDEVISKEAVSRLSNLVRHSSVLINILSTLTLEACLADVPVINVAFEGFDEIFNYEYAKRIIAANGTSLARDTPKLIKALNAYLENPGHMKTGRKNIVNMFCHSDDGQATKRLLEIIGLT